MLCMGASRYFGFPGAGVPPLGITNVHLVDIPRLPPAAQLARLSARLQPHDLCIAYLLGDFNFLTPIDDRLDITTGVHAYDDDAPVVRTFHGILPTYAETRAEG